MLGYIIMEDPSPTIMVYPTEDLAEFTATNRIQPMINDAPGLRKLYNERDSLKLEKQFEGMFLALVGANSPSQAASRMGRFLILDEYDKFPGATGKEAGAVALFKERTKAQRNSKIIEISTPTTRSGPIWKDKEAADVEYRFLLPCAHCKKEIELKFAQVKWPSKEEIQSATDRAERAMYICQACGAVITDRDKQKMMQAGEWREIRRQSSRTRSAAICINSLYSPFLRFSDIANEWMQSEGDPERRQNFINSWLGEPWEETKLKTDAELVLKRKTDVPEFAVPGWAKLLTAGIDVQESSVYWVIRAWGNHLTSQCIAYGQALSLSDAAGAMQAQYSREDGTPMIVALCLIDSGDQTDMVYDFCLANADWALPCKGVDDRNNHFRIGTVNKPTSRAYGMQLVFVSGHKYKDQIAAHMQKPNGTGSWMVHAGTGEDYAEQVTAEHKVVVRKGNGAAEKWVEKSSHADNHYLDAEVYAAAAADVRQVRLLAMQGGEEEAAPTEDPEKSPEAALLEESASLFRAEEEEQDSNQAARTPEEPEEHAAAENGGFGVWIV
jgi:phage terminase large subunit GpA-like protein